MLANSGARPGDRLFGCLRNVVILDQPGLLGLGRREQVIDLRQLEPGQGDVEVLQPELVGAVHTDYIDAGSDIVLTNRITGVPVSVKLSGAYRARRLCLVLRCQVR